MHHRVLLLRPSMSLRYGQSLSGPRQRSYLRLCVHLLNVHQQRVLLPNEQNQGVSLMCWSIAS